MTTPTARPPALFHWILRRVLSRDSVGRSIVGDLVEEYRMRRSRSGAIRARFWFYRQVADVVWHRVLGGTAESLRGASRRARIQDLRFALRSLRAKPAVHAMVLATVAVGVAGTALAFSMVDQALIRTLPFRAPQELYGLRHLSLEAGADAGRFSKRDMADLKEQLGWQSHLASYQFEPSTSVATLLGDGAPESVAPAVVDGDFFNVVGVPAALGRPLTPADDVPGKDGVVVLSHDFWVTRFSSDPDIVGKTLNLDGGVLEVVGVMPAAFEFPSPHVQIWIPLSRVTEDQVPDARGVRWLDAVVRVPDPGTAAEGRRAIEGVFGRLAAEYPESNDGWTRAELVPVRELLVGGFRSGVLFLMGTTTLLLLVVCTSVGGLLTARTAARRREMAIRLSVGADRRRLARQLMMESLLLATAGGAVGLVLAGAASPLVSRFSSETLGFQVQVTPDIRVAAFTGVVAVLAGLLFGLVPAAGVLRAPPGTFLGGARSGSGGSGGGGRRGLRALVLAETALAALLLVGSGLMLRSFLTLVETDPGFQTEDVWSMRLQLSAPGPESADLIQYRKAIVDAAAAVPGVRSVGGSKTPLLEGGGEAYQFTTVGTDGQPIDVVPESGTYVIMPGFFETLGASFVSGRAFVESDGGMGLVVNRTLADAVWPERDPLEQHLAIGETAIPVVGVVESLHDDGLEAGTKGAVYVDARFFPRTSFYLYLRTEAGASDAIQDVREAIWALNRDQAILESARITDLLDAEVSGPRWLARVIGVFGVLSLILAALGLYGVVSQAAQNRRSEIAVRMALGAAPGRVLSDQLRGGLGIVVLGTAVGLAVAAGAAQALSSLLFGIEAMDPLSFGGAAAAVILFGFLASLIPAARATRVDPAGVLREE